MSAIHPALHAAYTRLVNAEDRLATLEADMTTYDCEEVYALQDTIPHMRATLAGILERLGYTLAQYSCYSSIIRQSDHRIVLGPR